MALWGEIKETVLKVKRCYYSQYTLGIALLKRKMP